jgi:hypothetical protein
MKACTKSVHFCSAPGSAVSLVVFSSTCERERVCEAHSPHRARATAALPASASVSAVRALRVLRFMRMSTFMFSVTGVYSSIHASFSGVMRLAGTVTCAARAQTQASAPVPCM